jgi:kinesin family protein 5
MSNIKVFCRVRPLNSKEKKKNDNKAIKYKGVQTLIIDSKQFTFDNVFRDNSTQEDLYLNTVENIGTNILKGYNCTVIAYGLTGTGKTYTVMGTPNDKGIIPRLTQNIFNLIYEADEDIEFLIRVSYIEIYLEKIRDLLNPTKDNLRIRDCSYKGVWIQGLTEEYVSDMNDITKIIEWGNENRSTAETKMNEKSSRSHALFQITVIQTKISTGTKTSSKLVLVDLAGSESVGKTGASGLTLLQAQHTNKSLLTLGNVIRALYEKTSHIPYRDSKLTRILTHSLGGNSKTFLIVTCSPFFNDTEETISTMRFGTQVKSICNKPKANIERSIEEYKCLLMDANKKILALGGENVSIREIDPKEDVVLFKKIEEQTKENERLSDEKEKLIEDKEQLKEENRILTETLKYKDTEIKDSVITTRQTTTSKLLETLSEPVNIKNPKEISQFEKLSINRERTIKILEEYLESSNTVRRMQKKEIEKLQLKISGIN